jgi:hypothetical protein
MTELYNNDHWNIGERGGVHTLVRTACSYASKEEMVASLEGAVQALRSVKPDRLVVDLRLGPARNDDTFEAKMAGYRRQMFEVPRVFAVLVASKVGMLQVKRHLHEDGASAEVFDNEVAARSWLKAQGASRYRPPG